MITLAADAVKVRLDAAVAFRETSDGRTYPATELRSAYLFDAFKIVPGDLAEMARQLDGLTP